jgi:hypothetical protein
MSSFVIRSTPEAGQTVNENNNNNNNNNKSGKPDEIMLENGWERVGRLSKRCWKDVKKLLGRCRKDVGKQPLLKVS